MTDAQRMDWSTEEYHAAPQMSRSKLKAFWNDPELFHEEYVTKARKRIDKPTPSQLWGLDFESLLLNGDIDVAVVPEEFLTSNGRRPGSGEKKTAMIAWEAEQGGRRIFTPSEHRNRLPELQRAVDKTMECEKAKALLCGAAYHECFVCEYRGIEFRVQLDVINDDAEQLAAAGLRLPQGAIVDIKTDKDPSPRAFSRSCIDYWYHVQSWLYQYAVEQATGVQMPFLFIVSKNEPSYGTELYHMPPEFIDLGKSQADKAIDRYLLAVEQDCYQRETHDQVIDLYPPTWALKQQSEWEPAV